MDQKKSFYRGLSEVVGWISAIAFLFGVATSWSGQNILFSGNDFWQAALYLALFAIFSRHMVQA